MAERLTHTDASQWVNERLAGATFARLTYYITGWDIRFHGAASGTYNLQAAELTVPDLGTWRRAFSSLPLDLLSTSEPDDVITAAHLFSALNVIPVEHAAVEPSGDLILTFANAVSVRAPVKVEMVDWTWHLESVPDNQTLTCDSGPLFLSTSQQG